MIGWLVSNEMPLYGGPRRADVVAAWARTVVQAVRATGATQPISLGDGAWGVEVSGEDNGYSLRALAPLVDFVGPHSYPMQDDQLRQFLTPAFACELAGGFGKPVVLEEFGVSSDFACEESAAAYYRQVLHTTLLAGARGWLAWNNCDYDDLRDEDPYRHHVFELHFGLTDSNGRPKEQLQVMASFSELVRELAVDGWEPVKGDAAIVVPEHFERVLPFTSPEYRQDIGANLLQSYVAAREADLPVELVRERDGIRGGARLYLAPCAKLLTAPGLDRLRAPGARGCDRLPVVLRGQHARTSAGRGCRGSTRSSVSATACATGWSTRSSTTRSCFEFVEDLGELTSGTRLSFRVAGSRAPAPTSRRPAGADVVAVDGYGRPALVRHTLGAGQTVLCTYPLEHMAARTPWANPESTWRIYSALATVAGVSRPVRVDDPRVLAGCVRQAVASDTFVFVNCSRTSCRSSRSRTAAPSGDSTWPLTSTRSASRCFP